MPSREVISRLIREGWIEIKTSGGSHRQFKKTEEIEEEGGLKKFTRRVTVPSPRKDLPIGTLKSIYKQANWDWNI